MPGYLLNDKDVATLRDVTGRVLGKSVSGNANRHIDDEPEVGGGDSVKICVVTQAPNNGFGPATVREIAIAADGTWQAVGGEIAVICPNIE